MKITCIERKYRIEKDNVSCFIVAKRELSEDVTEKLLHEDMELKTFLEYYEIVALKYKTEELVISDIKAKPEIEGIIPGIETEKRAVLAKLPSLIRRTWVVLHEMPVEFALEDIIKFYKDKDEHYDTAALKTSYSYTLQHLKKEKKIEVIDTSVNRRYRRYRKLVDEQREYDKMLESLKQDKKILMGTIK